MTFHDIRKQVLALLGTTTDCAVIEEVYALVNDRETINSIAINKLPILLQTKIEKAMEDYKTGNYITQDEMKKK